MFICLKIIPLEQEKNIIFSMSYGYERKKMMRKEKIYKRKEQVVI